MGSPAGLACVRCGAAYPLGRYAFDCDRCRGEAPASLTVTYAKEAFARVGRDTLTPGPTLWRWAPFLPVDAGDAVSLGEGMTPLVRATRLSAELGAHVFVKDESRNPTWSFKDRLATVAISAARKLGARVIASSSSGNAGAAVAAYAAAAGLPCVVFTFQSAAGPMVTQMRAYGAMVLAVRDKADRWKLLEAGVRRFGWFPTSPFFAPVVGSNPLGLEGYKTLAYEICEQLGWQPPDWCILPVCYGDALYGMWKGFDEMLALGWIDRMPRLVAAEIYGSLTATLAAGGDSLVDMPKTHDSVASSLGATRGTYQGLHAVRASKGIALQISDDELLAWQAKLASREGLYGEPSSMAAIAAVERLRAGGVIGDGQTVVTVMTAGGLKDVVPTARQQGDVPVFTADIDAALETLRRAYGFAADEDQKC
jgi:threonine synthase